jgi:hypothetical protein
LSGAGRNSGSDPDWGDRRVTLDATAPATRAEKRTKLATKRARLDMTRALHLPRLEPVPVRVGPGASVL